MNDNRQSADFEAILTPLRTQDGAEHEAVDWRRAHEDLERAVRKALTRAGWQESRPIAAGLTWLAEVPVWYGRLYNAHVALERECERLQEKCSGLREENDSLCRDYDALETHARKALLDAGLPIVTAYAALATLAQALPDEPEWPFTRVRNAVRERNAGSHQSEHAVRMGELDLHQLLGS